MLQKENQEMVEMLGREGMNWNRSRTLIIPQVPEDFETSKRIISTKGDPGRGRNAGLKNTWKDGGMQQEVPRLPPTWLLASPVFPEQRHIRGSKILEEDLA